LGSERLEVAGIHLTPTTRKILYLSVSLLGTSQRHGPEIETPGAPWVLVLILAIMCRPDWGR
jgi:hypothetical protein